MFLSPSLLLSLSNEKKNPLKTNVRNKNSLPQDIGCMWELRAIALCNTWGEINHTVIVIIYSQVLDILFLKYFIYFFLERGREGERESNMDVGEIHSSVASLTPPSGDPACNPGIRPDWESNL